jgi:hypothetical protein
MMLARYLCVWLCLALQIGLHRSTSEVFRCADGSPPCEVQGQGKLVAGSVQASRQTQQAYQKKILEATLDTTSSHTIEPVLLPTKK